MKFDNLFATPVFTFNVKDAELLNAELLRDIKALQSASQGLLRSNQHGWHSENDFFKREEASFKRLAKALLIGIRAATENVAPGYDLGKVNTQVEGWINVNSRGAFNTPHDHSGFLWSGCYYVQIPQNAKGRSGMIEFLDPRTNIAASGLPDISFFATKTQRRPKAGMFYIFPSYLMHWVYPNEEEEERVSIAFNVRFLKQY